MSEQDKQEAAEHGKRAASQAKNAAKNAAKAAGHATRAGAEKAADVGEDFYDAAKDKAPDVADAVVDTASHVVDVGGDAVREVSRSFSARALAAMSGDTGVGFLALAAAIYAGAVAFNKFGSAYGKHNEVMRTSFGRKVG